jgi:hypothetical protein
MKLNTYNTGDNNLLKKRRNSYGVVGTTFRDSAEDLCTRHLKGPHKSPRN